ncbi:hypothetical protein SJAG_03269 [Schizosaccharomyces japonicus yFS275]|uniref:Uncharacterized protein n=1 Tax=Schizosaccharomyces japonicus (strain yFS275 / FY16936) TaxID=402676 RepID=B6K3S8_SCHJY|nr:hypothetical protein SJAG_03269 [Schizosaccharomyces japonicus yFS275]EEB08135.1 hypothetical protein SJAG_03269 [Schizosaccharomyces japonicus yFS275]
MNVPDETAHLDGPKGSSSSTSSSSLSTSQKTTVLDWKQKSDTSLFVGKKRNDLMNGGSGEAPRNGNGNGNTNTASSGMDGTVNGDGSARNRHTAASGGSNSSNGSSYRYNGMNDAALGVVEVVPGARAMYHVQMNSFAPRNTNAGLLPNHVGVQAAAGLLPPGSGYGGPVFVSDGTNLGAPGPMGPNYGPTNVGRGHRGRPRHASPSPSPSGMNRGRPKRGGRIIDVHVKLAGSSSSRTVPFQPSRQTPIFQYSSHFLSNKPVRVRLPGSKPVFVSPRGVTSNHGFNMSSPAPSSDNHGGPGAAVVNTAPPAEFFVNMNSLASSHAAAVAASEPNKNKMYPSVDSSVSTVMSSGSASTEEAMGGDAAAIPTMMPAAAVSAGPYVSNPAGAATTSVAAAAAGATSSPYYPASFQTYPQYSYVPPPPQYWQFAAASPYHPYVYMSPYNYAPPMAYRDASAAAAAATPYASENSSAPMPPAMVGAPGMLYYYDSSQYYYPYMPAAGDAEPQH